MSEATISDMPADLPAKLLALYEHDLSAPERCGFILPGGEVIEVKNICHQPMDGFDISAEDLLKYEDAAIGSWHTHTGTDCNLTRDDLASFLNYPHLDHYIVGSDGVARYAVDQGRVLRASTHPSARQSEEPSPGTD